MPDEALDALQSPEVARGARAQRERLKALLPEIAREGQPGAEEGPGRVPAGRTLEWAFACVRSRAFQVGSFPSLCELSSTLSQLCLPLSLWE